MNVVVVGGVAGGMSFAARCRRLKESANIVVFERDEHVSFANCGLPYYLGGEITDRSSLLLQTPESLHAALNLDVRVQHEVVSINRHDKTVRVHDHKNDIEFNQSYDVLAISTGAKPIVPPVPGTDLPGVFSLRNVADIDRIKAAADRLNASNAHAVVVGAGFIGLEVAEAFRHRGYSVSVIELANQVLAPLDEEMAAHIESELRRNDVDVRIGNGLTGISKGEHRALHIALSDGDAIEGDIAILAIGVLPESRLAKDADLACSDRGAIIVNEFQQTSDESIFAFGDATQVTDHVTDTPTVVPLAGPASRHARTAANYLFGKKKPAATVLGTAIVRVFDKTAAATGKNAKTLERMGIPFRSVVLHPADHAGYFPGAEQFHLKVLFAPDDGTLLGAQAVGGNGVDKRIDVLATAIRAGMSIGDLADLELAYAPPYGSAKDPINMAGFIGDNLMQGVLSVWEPVALEHLRDSDILLDVRSPSEFAQFHLEGAINIPHTELRAQLHQLDLSKRMLVYCASGFRSYLAARILQQNGCKDVSSLNGGLLSFYHRELSS